MFRVIPRSLLFMANLPTPEAAIGEVDELELLKLTEVAALFKVSKRVVETLVYSGELPSHKIRSNRRVRRCEALAYLQRTQVTS